MWSINFIVLSVPSSSGVDGDIYSLAEDPSEGILDIQPRSQTMDKLARSVLTNNSSVSDNNKTQNSMANSYGGFPFSSRPPQFNPSPITVKNNSVTTSHKENSPQLYRTYSQASKVILKSKPSLSNPNVLFCTPDDMIRSVINWCWWEINKMYFIIVNWCEMKINALSVKESRLTFFCWLWRHFLEAFLQYV